MRRRDVHNCFVCSPTNPIGLHVEFRLEDGVATARFVPKTEHQSYDGVTHGGILAAVLDDAMGNCFTLRGVRAVTAKLEVRFRRPVPIGCELRVFGKIVSEDSRAARAVAWATAEDRTVMVEGSATYVKQGEEGPARQ